MLGKFHKSPYIYTGIRRIAEQTGAILYTSKCHTIINTTITAIELMTWLPMEISDDHDCCRNGNGASV